MLRLVGEGESDTPVRRRAPLAELDLERNAYVEDVLATLADSRLVTVSEGNVEVAHEALLREWPRLREWIEEDGEGRRLRRHITQAAMEWNAAGRDQGELYRGARLAAALDWTADHALDVNELEREFVTESREASETETKRVRRINRRLRTLLVGVAVLLAAALAGGIFAVVQRGQARDAETAQFVQRLGAQALVEEDLDRSLLLARQAVAIDDSPQTRGYLFAALRRWPAALAVMHPPDASTYLRGSALSPDGRTLAVVDANAGLAFFDTRTYAQVSQGIVAPSSGVDPTAANAEAVAFSPDGRTLAFGGSGYVRVVDARTKDLLAEAASGTRLSRVAFTSDGRRLVVEESEGEGSSAVITIRDASTLKPIGAPIQPAGFHGSYISEWWTDPSIALTPDGRSVVTASPGGELAWWDLGNGKKTRELEIPVGQRALALSPDGLTAAIGLDRGIRLIDVRTRAVREANGTLASDPTWLLFSPDGKRVVSTSRDGTVTVWDVVAMTPLETLRGHSRAVQQPVFSKDGRTLYTVSHDGTAIAWDMSGDRQLGQGLTFTSDQGEHQFPDWHPGAFSVDGRLIAVGLNWDGIQLWDARELKPTGAPIGQTGGEVTALAFSPDGRTLVGVSETGVASVWDTDSRSLRYSERVDTYAIGVSISADGTMFAAAGGAGVTLWDTATGAAVGAIGDYSAGDVAFSPTESLVAFAREGTRSENQGDAEIWDVARKARPKILNGEGDPRDYYLGWAVAFSPDGRLLATPGRDRLVNLWDVRTGRLVRTFEHNVGTAVLSLEFSPDGSVLAISGGDSFASLWDVATGAQIGPRLTAGGRRDDGRLLARRQAPAGGARQRRGCRLGRRSRLLEAPGVRGREPHAEP